MKYLILALLVLSFPLAACEAKETVTGIYQEAFENGTIDPDQGEGPCKAPNKMIGDICATPYMATNTLGVFEQKSGNLDFSAELSFFNGHTCSIADVAKKSPEGWVFESEEMPGQKCKLLINIKNDKITFTVPEEFDCSYYCGARGSLDGAEFLFSSKIEKTVTSKDDLDCIFYGKTPCASQDKKE